MDSGEREKILRTYGKARELEDVVSKIIMHNQRFVTMMDTNEIYHYDSGIYRKNGDALIRQETEKMLVDVRVSYLSTCHLSGEIIGHIQRNTFKERNGVEPPLNLLCLQNGILDINAMQLLPFTPDRFFVAKLPVGYDPIARCPNFEKFLNDVLSKNDVPIIQELFGYCLYRDYPVQKIVMFLGEGSNGKSTILNVLEALIGRNNCSNLPLQQLTDGRFAVANLYGKFVNKFADLDSFDLEQTGVLKMLVGNDTFEADRKFKETINFRNYAKMVFSCNTLPRTKDRTDAFYRRWIIIPFMKKFEGANCDIHLLEKLTTPEELSGILNYSLIGLKRLLEQGAFTGTRTTEEIRETYDRLSDPIKAFKLDMLYTSAEAWIEKSRLYAAYVSYCNDKVIPAESKIKFSKRLVEEIRIHDYFRLINGQQRECWMGVKLKDNDNTKSTVNEQCKLTDPVEELI